VAHAKIAIACARYLLTCTEFTTGAPSPTAFGHIIKGFHDIFPYVHEFWPEHLTECVNSKGGRDDEIWKAVVDQLCRLVITFSRPAASMDLELSHQILATISTAASGQEFPAFPQLVQKYLDFRKSTSVTTTPLRAESGSANVKSDPTTLTDTYSCFRAVFESLVNDRPPFPYIEMKSNAADLDRFIHRHRSAAYCCRWSRCMRASTSFQTPTERADHENSHKKQFRCSDPTCDFANNGFASRGALRGHMLKYHTKEEDLVLPEFSLRGSKSNKAAGLAVQALSDKPMTVSGRGTLLPPPTDESPSPTPTTPAAPTAWDRALLEQADHGVERPKQNPFTPRPGIIISPFNTCEATLS
jgi:hypothetical protein